MSLRDQQLQHELAADAEAAALRLEELRTSSTEGDVSLPRAQRFIARAYSQVKQSLDDAIAVKTRGVGGKFKGWLRKIPTDVAAVIALRECLMNLTVRRNTDKHVTIQLLARSVGELYELEVRIRDAETVNPMYMQKIHEQVKDRGTSSTSHLRKLYSTAHRNIMKDEADDVLNASEILQLGKFGVQAVMDAGIITMNRSRGREGLIYAYELAPEVHEFLHDYSNADVAQIMNKASSAMMCAPDPWTNLRDGGYLSERRKFVQPLMSLATVRKSERQRLRDEFTAENMPVVFQAANYLQSVAFDMHRPTLDTIARLWQEGGGVLGVPKKREPQKPPFPFREDWVRDEAPPEELEAFQAWKHSCVRYYDDLREWRGKVREISGFLRTAKEAPERIWFPVFFDKRGRWYYRGTPNPQGSDISKAVLHLADKKPLGKRGLYWLKVHIANSFGYDKERLDRRAQWTDENWDAIQRALQAPHDYPEVWGTDAPWCMFAAAWELNQAYLTGSPETYLTGCIVHMDATCSGLQHFSAMLRDPVGGRYVNLYDDSFTGPKQDIYSKVSTNALQSIQLDMEDSDPAKAAMAAWWWKQGIPRGMAKTPVMTYVYGATLRGTSHGIAQFAKDEMDAVWEDRSQEVAYSAYAARKLFQGIAMTVPAADAAMQWLKAVARQMPCGQRMEWTSPTGFKVQHDYQDFDEVRVRIRSCGTDTVLVREWNEDTKPIPMANAIAPNFVHALDASHLTLTALGMQEAKLDMVGIHDSFGTHSCDVDKMHEIIRDAFVRMYQQKNVLVDFLWEVNGIGEVPMRGTLDLNRIRDSEFFFS